MLEVGNGGMSETEYRTHMSLWALLSAPLLAGNDLRHVKPEILHILTNRDVIAIHQDPLGHQGRRVKKDGNVEVWTKPLSGGALAVAIFNRGEATARATIGCADLQQCGGSLRDLWVPSKVGSFGACTRHQWPATALSYCVSRRETRHASSETSDSRSINNGMASIALDR